MCGKILCLLLFIFIVGDLDSIHTTAIAETAQACAPGSKTGVAGSTDHLKTQSGVLYNVRTPVTYDPTKTYPLMVVYPGAGENEDSDEPKVQLTKLATSAGYIIVYTGHYSPIEETALQDAASVPTEVAAQWCIDREQVFLLGNSDGASTASLIVLRNLLKPPPAALVVNAAGVSASSLLHHYESAQCPATKPIPYMSMHGTQDDLFKIPYYGINAASVWALCSGCRLPPGEVQANGCRQYPGCSAAVTYCEYKAAHGVWEVSLNRAVMDFINQYRN